MLHFPLKKENATGMTKSLSKPQHRSLFLLPAEPSAPFQQSEDHNSDSELSQ